MPKAREQQQEDQEEAGGHDDRAAACARRSSSRTGRPSRASSPGGQLDLAVDLGLRLGDERADVAAAHVGLHDDPPLAVLAADLVRPLGHLESRRRLSSGTKRRTRARRPSSPLPSRGTGTGRCSSRGDVLADVVRQAHHDVEPPVALEHLPASRPADRDRRPRPARRRRSGRGGRSPSCSSLTSRTGRPVGLLDLDVGSRLGRAQHGWRSGWRYRVSWSKSSPTPSPRRRRARRRSAR